MLLSVTVPEPLAVFLSTCGRAIPLVIRTDHLLEPYKGVECPERRPWRSWADFFPGCSTEVKTTGLLLLLEAPCLAFTCHSCENTEGVFAHH